MDYGDIFMNDPAAHEYLQMLGNQSSANNLFNAEQAQKQMDFQTEANAKAMSFSHREAELNREWQTLMSNTAYQRQVKDMIASGLNPVLGVSNSGASVGSVGNPTGTGSAGAKADADTSVNQAMSNFMTALINGATQREVAQTQSSAAMENARVGAAATMYAADASSSAARYAASVNAAAYRHATDANIEWQREYNQLYNPIGMVYDFLDYIEGKSDSKGLLSRSAETVFDSLFGNTGIALTAKGGRTVHINSLNSLRNLYTTLTNTSKDILKKLAYGYKYGQ